MIFTVAGACTESAVRGGAEMETTRARVLNHERARTEMIARVMPSVVAIQSATGQGGGSGVLIDDEGYGLSNFHVLAKALGAEDRYVGALEDGGLYPLEVLGVDPTGDVAMFRLTGNARFPSAGLGDSDAVRVGDTAIAMGNPFSMSEDGSPSVTSGIVTGIHRYQWGVKGNLIYSDCIQIDASINPGSSGGPLFNEEGEIVGINGRISVNTRGRFNVGFGYAITSNQIKRFMPAMRAGLLARHGTLQATVEDRLLRGVLFDKVAEKGAAQRAGIRVGDRLIAFDGTTIQSPNHFVSVSGAYPEDWRVPLVIERDGAMIEKFVRLDPIEPKLRHPFRPDRTANFLEVERVLRSYRAAMVPGPSNQAPHLLNWTIIRERDAAGDGESPEAVRYEATISARGPAFMRRCDADGPGAETVEFDETGARRNLPGLADTLELPRDEVMQIAARFVMHKLVLAPFEEINVTDVRHVGGNALGRPSAIVEVIEWPVASNAVARLWFREGTFDLVRMEVRDLPSGVLATIDVYDYVEVDGVRRPSLLEARCQDYHYRDRLVDWEVLR